MGTKTAERQYEGRYTFGRRSATGRIPVYVDGAESPSGWVWSTGHGAQPWTAEGSATVEATYPDFHARRWQAAERIVALIDARKVAAREAAQRARGAGVPDGWRRASWEEIAREGFRRVRLITAFGYVDPAHNGTPDGGERYAVSYAAEPVRLVALSRHSRVPQYQATYGDFLSLTTDGGASPHIVDGDHAIALGALVPVDSPRRTLSSVACPHCGADAMLYASGARTACGRCTARHLGWTLEDLPHPEHEDEAPMFQPGAAVSLELPGTDGVTDTYTGTVYEWTARLDGWSTAPLEQRSRTVRVAFQYGYGQTSCDPARLRAVDAVTPLSDAVCHGWRVGTEAVRFDYNRDGVAFERRGYVVGCHLDPETGAHVLRFSTAPGAAAATPYPADEVYRIGSHEAWSASRTRRP